MVESLYAGESKTWILKRDPQFPPKCKIEAFLRSGASKLEVLKVFEEGERLRINLSPSVSEGLHPGLAALILRVTNGDDFQKTTIISRLNVLASPLKEDEAFDAKTEAEICLQQAEAALADYTKGRSKVKSYTIGTRSLTFNDAQELLDLVSYWRKQVYLERCGDRNINPRKQLVEFVQ